MALDPEDPRPPYQQVAASLRAAILTGKFGPGDKLPSGSELSTHYGVARMTVQQALRLLRDDGLIVSRQGSGVFVRRRTERPVGLRPYVERAFEQPDVTVDFAGISGETLHGVLSEPLDQIRTGRLSPQSIGVRVLIPDTSLPWTLPSRVGDGADVPGFRALIERLVQRHLGALNDTLTELAELSLVPKTSMQVRTHSLTPLFKLYVINGEDVFFGYYPIQERTRTFDGDEVTYYDLGGKDAPLMSYDGADPDAPGAQEVTAAREWFDSVWSTVSRERTL